MPERKDWKFTITNITMKQAKELASWYSGQGEQDADIWFDCNGVETPMTNDRLTKTNVDDKEVRIVAQ